MVDYSVMDHFFSFGIAYITGGLVFIGIIVTCFTILQDHFTMKNLLIFRLVCWSLRVWASDSKTLRWFQGELIKGYFCNGDYCVFGDVETGARTSKPSFVNPAKRTKSSVPKIPSKMNPFNKNKKHIETCDQAIQNV